MKKILLVTNDTSLTGAPILLLELAKYLSTIQHFIIEFWSVFPIPSTQHSMTDQFESIGSVKFFNGVYPSQKDIQLAKEIYDLIICNTVETTQLCVELNAIMWYHEMFIPDIQMFNRIKKVVTLSNKHTNFLKLLGASTIFCSLHSMFNNQIININNNKNISSNVSIIVIGSFIQRKNQLGALDIVKPYYNIHLTMIGSFKDYETGLTTYYQSVKDKVKYLHMEDRVSLIDTQTHDNVLKYISNCDILLCPSFHDTYPVCVIEALEHGKTVLLTKNTCLDLDEILVKPYSSRSCSLQNMSDMLGRLLSNELYKRKERLQEYDYAKHVKHAFFE